MTRGVHRIEESKILAGEHKGIAGFKYLQAGRKVMAEIPEPLSVEEALRNSEAHIRVPEGEMLSIGAFEDSYRDAYRIAKVTSFEELHLVSAIPEGLSEREVADAMAADDRLGLERRRSYGENNCACNEERINRFRMPSHPNLAATLRGSLRRPYIAETSAEVVQIRKAADRWLKKPTGSVLIGVVTASHIDIKAGATLRMTPAVHTVYADRIDIWDGAVLRLDGGSVYVRCEELNGHYRQVTHPAQKIAKKLPGISLKDLLG